MPFVATTGATLLTEPTGSRPSPGRPATTPQGAVAAAEDAARGRGRARPRLRPGGACRSRCATRSRRCCCCASIAAHDPVLQPAGIDRAGVSRAAQTPLSTVVELAEEDQIDERHAARRGRARGRRRPRAARCCGPPTRPRTRRPTTCCARCAAAARSSTSTSSRGSPTRRIVVQFLMPILILVCLFAFFMRIGQDGGRGRLRRLLEARQPRQEAQEGRAAGHVRRRRGRGRGGRRAARDPRLPRRPEPVRDAWARRRRKGVLLVGPPGHRQDAARARRPPARPTPSFFSLSGSEFVESLVGVGAARVRDLFERARKMAPAIVFIDELDAAGRAPRRRRRPGQRRARADAQPAAGRDGRLRRRRRHRRDGRHQPPRHPRPRAAAARAASTARSRSTCPTCTAASRSSSCTAARGRWRPDASLMEIAKLTPGLHRRRARERDQRGGAADRARGPARDRPARRSRRRSTASSPGRPRRATC